MNMKEQDQARSVVLGVVAVFLAAWLGLKSAARHGDPFWWLHEILRSAREILHGEGPSPGAEGLSLIGLLVGTPLLAFATYRLIRRERDDLQSNGWVVLAAVGLAAGSVLFTFPAAYILVGKAALAAFGAIAIAVCAALVYFNRGAAAPGRAILLLGAAACWGCYAVYEDAVTRWSAKVMGAIRVDVLIVMPLLFVATACAVWLLFGRWEEKESAPKPLRSRRG